MQNTRILKVSESARSLPKITLTGSWLQNYGFNIGDTVTVTSTEPGILVVQLNLTGPQLQHIEQARKQELETLTATTGLRYEANRKVVRERPAAIQKVQME